jgi:trk system potassium uptake protein TrkH
MPERRQNRLIFLIFALSIPAFFIEYGMPPSLPAAIVLHLLDLTVLAIFIADFIARCLRSDDRIRFLKEHPLTTLMVPSVSLLFLWSKYLAFAVHSDQLEYVSLKIIFLRYVFLGLKMVMRTHKFTSYMRAFYRNPAQTAVLSFASVITAGTMLLMLPYSTVDGIGLDLINALFTATSAVCVTGLIVVDTAVKFTLFGKAVILILIQCGGLGIMILTYFTAFLVGRRVTLEEKIEISYLLNEQDMAHLTGAVVKIIAFTFVIEFAGLILLLITFGQSFGLSFKALFYSVFHAVSAFCNAGFALFTNNLESYRSNLLLNFTIAVLIILGGLSFPVLMNIYQCIKDRVKMRIGKTSAAMARLTLNSVVVLVVSGILVAAGTLLIYGLEHRHNLIGYDLKTQYLASFFQSVTLRTAGFNTINTLMLSTPTLLIMMLFMFIGGAAGSTAGGVKVNTVAVVYAYIKSIFQNRFSVILHGHFLQKYVVSRALLILLIAALGIFTSTVILSATENFPLHQIMFETVSAFGTVGLSTGITPALTDIGKVVITATMFFGRLGPMTIVAALSVRRKHIIRYPEGRINMG